MRRDGNISRNQAANSTIGHFQAQNAHPIRNRRQTTTTWLSSINAG